MTRRLAFFSVVVAATMSIFAANELPKKDDDESFEIEPPLLIPNRDAEKSPVANASATPAPIVDPDKLEKDLERAKRSAAGAERLFKIGAIAKVEAEQRILRVARLQSELENARLALAKEALTEQETRVAAGEISKAELTNTETSLAHAIQIAHTAAANREQAELAFAESNLHRQQKLLALGSGRKSDVSRAEQKLAELRAAKND
jgi:hypothetical protein